MAEPGPADPGDPAQADLPALLGGNRAWRLAALILNGVAQAGAAFGTTLLVQAAFSRLVAGGPQASLQSLLPLAANVNEKIASMGVVQVYGQTERERLRLRSQSRQLRSAMVGKAQAAGRMRGITEATALLASVVALMVGAAEVGSGAATPGTVV